MDVEDKQALKELKELSDQGVLDDAEFKAAKATILTNVCRKNVQHLR